MSHYSMQANTNTNKSTVRLVGLRPGQLQGLGSDLLKGLTALKSLSSFLFF